MNEKHEYEKVVDDDEVIDDIDELDPIIADIDPKLQCKRCGKDHKNDYDRETGLCLYCRKRRGIRPRPQCCFIDETGKRCDVMTYFVDDYHTGEPVYCYIHGNRHKGSKKRKLVKSLKLVELFEQLNNCFICLNRELEAIKTKNEENKKIVEELLEKISKL